MSDWSAKVRDANSYWILGPRLPAVATSFRLFEYVVKLLNEINHHFSNSLPCYFLNRKKSSNIKSSTVFVLDNIVIVCNLISIENYY